MSTHTNSKLVERYAKANEAALIEKYILEGPAACKRFLKLEDPQWREIFDYLVFDHQLLYKCVVHNTSFFVDAYVKNGMAEIRYLLNADDEKYNKVFEQIFDFIAIANEGLFYHIIEHHDRYMNTMRTRGSDFVKKVLNLNKPKYEGHWEKVMDILLNAVCKDIFSENTFDHGLSAFSRVMNGMREHKPLVKHKFF